MYRGALRSETRYGIARALSNVSRSLEFVVEERLSALELLIEEKSVEELSDNDNLAATLANLERSFGGFKSMSEAKYISTMPFLGDIPLIKNLFRRKAEISEKRSLVILITARIINPRLEESQRFNE